VRDRPRDRGNVMLSALVKRDARARVAVKYISKCPNGLYMFTSEGVWRTEDKGVHWDRLMLGPMGEGNTVRWVSCSWKQPGHMVINTNGGPLESFDYGDTFGLWKNPFPRAQLLPIAGPGEDDLLFVMDEHWLYQERKDGHYEVLGHIIGDSVEADSPHWTWAVPDWGMRFVVTGDGMLVLDENGTRRVNEERLARRPLRFPYVDETVPGHVFAATENEVYESFDYAQTFEHIFTSPTERTIIRMTMHADRPGDLIVVTGGQLWRRIWDDDAQLWELPQTTRSRVDRILRSAPLWDTVETSLSRIHLLPEQIAAQRTNVRFRSLLPDVVGRIAYADGSLGLNTNVTYGSPGVPIVDLFDTGATGHTIWSVFFFWDLRDFFLDPLQLSTSWVDIERLRLSITWDVQDTWAKWSRSVTALADPTLTPAQHAYHEISRREAAAFLNHMTGGKFAAFGPVDPAGAPP
jgi:hypothetical protein